MSKPSSTDPKESFVNPIDKDKIAENPHLLPYAHTVGGVVIKPIDRGRTKGLSLTSMYDQTDIQMDQIRQQIELLAAQAKKLQDRVKISEMIYLAQMNFKPVVSKIYSLYQRTNEQYVLSLIGPDEWGKNAPMEFVATVKLMADHTWEVIDSARPIDIPADHDDG